MELSRIRLLGMDISLGNYASFIDDIFLPSNLGKSRYVCVANVHMLVEAHNDKSFQDIVNSADIITPDGMPLALGIKALYHLNQDRVAGMDILPDILAKAQKEAIPVYFYGGTITLLDKTREFLASTYPKLIVSGSYSPPFRNLFDYEEDHIISAINSSGAKIVFVVLGCPKQEKWMHKMKGRINCTMIGIGGALPVMVGLQKRAPKWMQKASLEWFYRFMQEPKRLFKRYAVTNSVFLGLFIKQFLNHRLNKS